MLKKMMKLLMIPAFAFALVGCGDSDNYEEPSKQDDIQDEKRDGQEEQKDVNEEQKDVQQEQQGDGVSDDGKVSDDDIDGGK